MITTPKPNFDKIQNEAGPFTSEAVQGIWSALTSLDVANDRLHTSLGNMIRPKTLHLTAAASVDNQDLGGSSIVSFEGTTAQNLTGFTAPPTGRSWVVIVQTNGTGTITMKNSATSQTANQIVTNTGADVTLSQGKGAVLVYVQSKWRQVA